MGPERRISGVPLAGLTGGLVKGMYRALSWQLIATFWIKIQLVLLTDGVSRYTARYVMFSRYIRKVELAPRDGLHSRLNAVQVMKLSNAPVGDRNEEKGTASALTRT